ncbi:MAG: FAD-binding oxidoreductase, partial [Armatimonadetes bacterium]|nr:FAD-binding oxidoreductase [Armatimonadota bacterium]
GSTGTSVAFQLARRGAGRVVLVERGAIGSGPTSQSMGIIRLHYSYEPLIRLALRSLELFSHFEDLSGGTADFTRAGFLLAASSAQIPALRDNVALQQRLGVRTSVLTPAQLKDLDPRLEVSDLGGAAYEPESGFADGYATASSFASAARRMGAKILEQTTVERIVVEGGHVQAVVTSGDTISTPRTLVAAGPWTPSVLEPLGIRVPIESSREQVVQLAPPPEFGRLRRAGRPDVGTPIPIGCRRSSPRRLCQPVRCDAGLAAGARSRRWDRGPGHRRGILRSWVQAEPSARRSAHGNPAGRAACGRHLHVRVISICDRRPHSWPARAGHPWLKKEKDGNAGTGERERDNRVGG